MVRVRRVFSEALNAMHTLSLHLQIHSKDEEDEEDEEEEEEAVLATRAALGELTLDLFSVKHIQRRLNFASPPESYFIFVYFVEVHVSKS